MELYAKQAGPLSTGDAGKITVPCSHIRIGFQGLASLGNEKVITELRSGSNKTKGYDEINLKSLILLTLAQGGAVVQTELNGLFYAFIPISALGGFQIEENEYLFVKLIQMNTNNEYQLNGIEDFVPAVGGRVLMKSDSATMQVAEEKRDFVTAGFDKVAIRGFDKLTTIEMTNEQGYVKTFVADELKTLSIAEDEIKEISIPVADRTKITSFFEDIVVLDLDDIKKLTLKKDDTTVAVNLDYLKL